MLLELATVLLPFVCVCAESFETQDEFQHQVYTVAQTNFVIANVLDIR